MSDKIKIFQVNDVEWFAAKDLNSAILEAASCNGLNTEEVADCPRELTEAEMDEFIFTDDIDAPEEKKVTRTFREQLDKLIEAGERFPRPFATSEF